MHITGKDLIANNLHRVWNNQLFQLLDIAECLPLDFPYGRRYHKMLYLGVGESTTPNGGYGVLNTFIGYLLRNNKGIGHIYPSVSIHLCRPHTGYCHCAFFL